MTSEVKRCNNDIGNKGVAYMKRQTGAACFRIPSVREDDSPGSELTFLFEKRDFYHRLSVVEVFFFYKIDSLKGKAERGGKKDAVR